MSLAAMCIQGSVMIVLVLTARGLLGRALPRMAFYVLWLIVLARLLVPMAIPLPGGLWTSLGHAATSVERSIEALATANPSESTGASANTTQAAGLSGGETTPAGITSSQEPAALLPGATSNAKGIVEAASAHGNLVASSPEPSAAQPAAAGSPAWLDGLPAGIAGILTGIAGTIAGIVSFLDTLPLGAIWAIGTGTLVICLSALYITMIVALRRNSHDVEHPAAHAWLAQHRLARPLHIRTSPLARSPFTYGIVHPVIVVPPSFSWDDGRPAASQLVLAHEFAHVRRFDPLLKGLLAAALCLHWFNPLVWVMYLACSRDIELSCDELATRKLSGSGRRSYALALLGATEARQHPLVLASAFGSSPLSARIAAVMRNGTPSVPVVLASVALALACALACATTAAGAQSSEGTPVDSDLPLIQETTTARPSGDSSSPMHGSSPLVSEFATDEGTCLRTPHYEMTIPDAFLPDGFAWEFGDGNSGPLPAGAFDVLAIRDAGGRVAAYAFCMPFGSDDAQISGSQKYPDVTGYRFFSELMMDDWSGYSWVYVSSEFIEEMGGIDAPDVRAALPRISDFGSLSKVYGLVQGQAAQEAYIAHATHEEGGVRIHVPGYSVLVPAPLAAQEGVSYRYTDHSYDGAPTCAQLYIFSTATGEVITFFKATDAYDAYNETYCDGVSYATAVGTSSDGMPVMASVSGIGAPTDATAYAQWVRIE